MNAIIKNATAMLRVSNFDQVDDKTLTENVVIFGNSGSGKTSGSGAAFRNALLRSGAGGVFLSAKPSDPQDHVRAAQKNGRASSVIVFGHDGKEGCNFIELELARRGSDGIGSIVDNLLVICDAASQSNGGGNGSDNFWRKATAQVLRKSVPILYAAFGTVRLPELMRFIQTAPTTSEQMTDETWQEKSFWFSTMAKVRQAPSVAMPDDEFSQIGRYWASEYSRLDGKTRGNVVISLSTVLDRFISGPLNRMFCGKTTIVPEMTWHGALVIMDIPTLTYNEDGIIAQKLMKHLWQRAALTRHDARFGPEHSQRLIFCYADEAQIFVAPGDADFLATSRSSNASTIYITQSLPGLYARIGGLNPKHTADMLLTNFQTKIFHNNSDPETNRWAAEIIGKNIQLRSNSSQGESHGQNFGMNMGEGSNVGTNSSVSYSTDAQGNTSRSMSFGNSVGTSENHGRSRGTNSGYSRNSGVSEVMDYEVEPGFFARSLLTGGPANGGIVTALWFQGGRRFVASSCNYLLVRFNQAS